MIIKFNSESQLAAAMSAVLGVAPPPSREQRPAKAPKPPCRSCGARHQYVVDCGKRSRPAARTAPTSQAARRLASQQIRAEFRREVKAAAEPKWHRLPGGTPASATYQLR